MRQPNLRQAFFAALFLQVLILVAVPAQKMRTLLTGRTIYLQVAPVDPYSIMSGYYVILSYDIQRLDAISSAAARLDRSNRRDIFVTVEERSDGIWHPIAASHDHPGSLPGSQAVLRGRFRQWGRLTFGIEEFFIPEERRREINDDLQKNRARARVEVKVDDSGDASLVALHIENRVYR